MRLRSLTSIAPGIVNADVVLRDGEILNVEFTTQTTGGITVASPEPSSVLQTVEVSVDETRRIVAAVIAFEIAASG